MTYRLEGLTALGDPTRRAIFERLAERPLCGRRAAARAAGKPARRLPASEGAQGRRAGDRPARRQPPHLPAQPGRGRRPARRTSTGSGTDPWRPSRRPSSNETRRAHEHAGSRHVRPRRRSSSRRRSSARSRCSPRGSASWWPPDHHILDGGARRDGLRAARRRQRLRPRRRRQRVPLGPRARL